MNEWQQFALAAGMAALPGLMLAAVIMLATRRRKPVKTSRPLTPDEQLALRRFDAGIGIKPWHPSAIGSTKPDWPSVSDTSGGGYQG